MRIAFYSPLNPRRSGVSDYSEELLPALGRLADIDVFVDGYIPSNDSITARFRVHDTNRPDFLRVRPDYDIALYHMGNSVLHEFAFRILSHSPGVTVLHDWILHHAVVEMTVAKGDRAGYVREMAYGEGLPGAE